MISRRELVLGALALGVLPIPRSSRAGAPAPAAPGIVGEDGSVRPELVPHLEQSPYAYVSPLRSDGTESTCHGEVWYAWLDGAVVTTTSQTSWKARALARNLDRARVWIGDYGRWRSAFGRNEDFRRGPSFLARVSRVERLELNDRVLAVYEKKYPEEIGRWSDRMREEVASGKRVILRYQPIGG